ncbi:MAG: anti-sigma factor family protein, partial [Candidatus Zipacnadales bacterium]
EEATTMKCTKAIKLIHQVLDGEASEEAVARLKKHTQTCQACADRWRTLAALETALQQPLPDEPGDTYFAAMARVLSDEISQRAHIRQKAPALLPAWSFSVLGAAACLLLGLGIGHFVFPRTLTRTVVKHIEVPGPERVIVREIQVPVEVVKWRPRTVVRYLPRQPARQESVPQATHEVGRRAPPVEATALTPPTPVTVMAEAPGEGSPATPEPTWTTYSTSGGRSIGPQELQLLARRLTADMGGALDSTLRPAALAARLASDLSTVEREMDRVLETEANVARP